jgi:hypothetical protein
VYALNGQVAVELTALNKSLVTHLAHQTSVEDQRDLFGEMGRGIVERSLRAATPRCTPDLCGGWFVCTPGVAPCQAKSNGSLTERSYESVAVCIRSVSDQCHKIDDAREIAFSGLLPSYDRRSAARFLQVVGRWGGEHRGAADVGLDPHRSAIGADGDGPVFVGAQEVSTQGRRRSTTTECGWPNQLSRGTENTETLRLTARTKASLLNVRLP